MSVKRGDPQLDRNRIWPAHRAAAVNLNRLVNLGLHPTETGWALA